jgi:hypothetical protein
MCEENGRRMVGELLSFKQRSNMTVSVDRSVKLQMKWNGLVYEGRMGGLSFTTNGPLIRAVQTGR